MRSCFEDQRYKCIICICALPALDECRSRLSQLFEKSCNSNTIDVHMYAFCNSTMLARCTKCSVSHRQCHIRYCEMWLVIPGPGRLYLQIVQSLLDELAECQSLLFSPPLVIVQPIEVFQITYDAPETAIVQCRYRKLVSG